MLRSRRMLTLLSLIIFILQPTKTRKCRPITENRIYVPSSLTLPIPMDFFLMQSCTLSQQKEIERLHVNDLDDCKDEVIRLRGLAFNFADLERMENDTENCIIYECPEFNVTALKQYESIYHYYSSYAKIWPSENMTCIPREGVYMLTKEKLNYTDAIDKCDSHGGMLMNVITEEATRRAANVISKSKISTNPSRLQAYVGLDDMKGEGKFYSLCGDPLIRSPWRGWAPGEPRSRYDSEDCVTIDSVEHWRVQPCDKKIPFLCEMLPGGPLNLSEVYCFLLEDAAEKQRCIHYYMNNHIEMQLSSDETCAKPDEHRSNIITDQVEQIT